MGRDSEDQTRLSVGTLAQPTGEQIRAARLATARGVLRRHPDDPAAARAELATLLDILGLGPADDTTRS